MTSTMNSRWRLLWSKIRDSNRAELDSGASELSNQSLMNDDSTTAGGAVKQAGPARCDVRAFQVGQKLARVEDSKHIGAHEFPLCDGGRVVRHDVFYEDESQALGPVIILQPVPFAKKKGLGQVGVWKHEHAERLVAVGTSATSPHPVPQQFLTRPAPKSISHLSSPSPSSSSSIFGRKELDKLLNRASTFFHGSVSFSKRIGGKIWKFSSHGLRPFSHIKKTISDIKKAQTSPPQINASMPPCYCICCHKGRGQSLSPPCPDRRRLRDFQYERIPRVALPKVKQLLKTYPDMRIEQIIASLHNEKDLLQWRFCITPAIIFDYMVLTHDEAVLRDLSSEPVPPAPPAITPEEQLTAIESILRTLYLSTSLPLYSMLRHIRSRYPDELELTEMQIAFLLHEAGLASGRTLWENAWFRGQKKTDKFGALRVLYSGWILGMSDAGLYEWMYEHGYYHFSVRSMRRGTRICDALWRHDAKVDRSVAGLDMLVQQLW